MPLGMGFNVCIGGRRRGLNRAFVCVFAITVKSSFFRISKDTRKEGHQKSRTPPSVARAAFHLGRATMAKVLDSQHHVLVFAEILRAPLTTTKNHAKALKDRAG